MGVGLDASPARRTTGHPSPVACYRDTGNFCPCFPVTRSISRTVFASKGVGARITGRPHRPVTCLKGETNGECPKGELEGLGP